MMLIDVTDSMLVPSTLCSACHGTGTLPDTARACQQCKAGKDQRHRERALLAEMQAARRVREGVHS